MRLKTTTFVVQFRLMMSFWTKSKVKMSAIMSAINVGNNVGNISLNKTEKKVISLLIEDSEYTADELASKIGVTKRTIERAFISLQKKKVIERIGSNRKGNWIVIK